MEKFVIQGGVPLSRRAHRGRQQERGAADPRRLPADRGGAAAAPGAADPRYRSPARPARAARRRGRVGRPTTACGSAPAGVTDVAVDEELSKQIRASFLLAGPLLARFGEARMPPPGGDFIGRRRLDAHLDAFKDLGARVDGDRWIELSAPAGGLCPCAIFMDEPSVMGTENALMAAALTPGPTTISNAASRAARPGSRSPALRDGRPGGRDRLQRDDGSRPRPPRRRRAHDLRRPHRGRQLHGTRRRDRRRAAHPRRRADRPGDGAAPVPPPRPALGDRGQRR